VATVERPGNALGTAIQVVVLLLLLAILGGVLVVVLAATQAIGAPGQAVQAVSGVTDQASRAVTSAQQALRDATDPAHPPSGLSYDTEFTQLQTWKVGERLPDASRYSVTLQTIRRRDNAESTDTAQYAVVHVELRQPNETRFLGQVIRSDNDAHDYVVYKGETFRIGRTVYRVNWVSSESGAFAAGAYRHPDAVRTAFKFDYE
jgi:hypothetical protein